MIANLTLRKLIQAAERGVKVVLIIEHLNFYLKHSLYKELKKKGGIIIAPNPVTKILTNIMNSNTVKTWNRYHQKVSLIDSDLFVGSINIAEEYSDIKYGTNKFVDLNIYVKNTICKNKVLRFFREILLENTDQIPQSNLGKIEQLFDELKIDSDINDVIEDRVEEFLEELPPKKSEVQDKIYDLLASSKDSILIIQSYYLNLKKIEDLIISAVKRGVKVQVVTGVIRDQTAYRHIYNSDLFANLLNNGVEVYEYMDNVLHVKAYYVDNKVLTLGSLNNDITSFSMNNEANYLVKRNSKNDDMFEDFEFLVKELKKNSKRVNLYDYKNFFRLSQSYFWYGFLNLMEKTGAGRKIKYDK